MLGDRRPVPLLLLAGWIVFAPAPLSAWGPEGHRIVAALAEAWLTPDASRAVRDLLDDGSLESVATWADDIRKDRRDTAPWHYVNIPKEQHEYDPARDCATPRAGDCVVAAIERFRAVLVDPATGRAERVEALKFLTHLVADAHQPLHCLAEEEGGNRITVRFLGETLNPRSLQPWNLHAVWDSGLLDHGGLAERDYVARLAAWLRSRPPDGLRQASPAGWAVESHEAALRTALALPEDRHLDERYLRRSLPVVEERLALAGFRLAGLLNDALRHQGMPSWRQRRER